MRIEAVGLQAAERFFVKAFLQPAMLQSYLRAPMSFLFVSVMWFSGRGV